VQRGRTRILGVGLVAAAVCVAAASPAGAWAADAAQHVAANALTAFDAIVLGIVEGVTEFLPISSTGHLLVAERIMDIGQTDATKQAADTYTVVIQIGAILAVLILYFGRVRSMFEGAIGRDPAGKRALIGVLVAFVPAALVGVYMTHFSRPDTVDGPQDGVTYLRFTYCGSTASEPPEARARDPDSVRTVWMGADELRACPERHRTPLVMQCIDDYLAGRRFPLDFVHTHSVGPKQ